MMPQAHARHTDPSTSHRAAEAVSIDLPRLQRRVLDWARLRGGDGFTDIELEAAFMDHGSTFRTRRRELVDRLLIKDSGRRVRLEGEARQRIVWVITAKGRRA